MDTLVNKDILSSRIKDIAKKVIKKQFHGKTPNNGTSILGTTIKDGDAFHVYGDELLPQDRSKEPEFLFPSKTRSVLVEEALDYKKGKQPEVAPHVICKTTNKRGNEVVVFVSLTNGRTLKEKRSPYVTGLAIAEFPVGSWEDLVEIAKESPDMSEALYQEMFGNLERSEAGVNAPVSRARSDRVILIDFDTPGTIMPPEQHLLDYSNNRKTFLNDPNKVVLKYSKPFGTFDQFRDK